MEVEKIMPSIADITSLQDQINDLKKRVQDIRNIFLNIKLNSDMFWKLSKLEQREIQRDQEIAKLKEKVNGTSNGCSLAQQNLEFVNQHEKTLNFILDHDIFKIWKSTRQGGKNTLAAILNPKQTEKKVYQMPDFECYTCKKAITELKKGDLLYQICICPAPNIYNYELRYYCSSCAKKYFKNKEKLDVKEDERKGDKQIAKEYFEYMSKQTEKKDHFKEINGKIVEFGYGLKKDSGGEKTVKCYGSIPNTAALLVERFDSVAVNKEGAVERMSEDNDGRASNVITADSTLPKLNVPKKFTPFNDISIDRGKPDEIIRNILDDDVPYCYQDKCARPYETPESFEKIKEFFEPNKLPEDYKPIEEITTKRKDYMDAKVPSNFELRIDDIIEGKLVAEPDTIDFNGTIYCKVKDVIIDIKTTVQCRTMGCELCQSKLEKYEKIIEVEKNG